MKNYILILVLLSGTACAMDVLVAGQITKIRGMDGDDGQGEFTSPLLEGHVVEMGELVKESVEDLQQKLDELKRESTELNQERIELRSKYGKFSCSDLTLLLSGALCGIVLGDLGFDILF